MHRLTVDEINQKFEQKGKTVRVLYEVDSDTLMCKCLKCNQEFKKPRKNMSAKFDGCPVCKNFVVVKGYNDIATKAPWMIEYLANKEDAYNYCPTSERKVLIKCPHCNNERPMVLRNLFIRGFSCPCTKERFGHIITGINDVATKAPWMLEYFVDKSLAYKYGISSHKYADFKCPECGTIINRKIMHIHRNGFCCPVCSDGVSYPNKFVRAFIKQTNANKIDFEFRRDWTDNRFFDIYFELDEKKYFIEVDGGIHFKDFRYRTLEDQQQNDEYKNKIAKEHNIIMIRIDCRESKKDYIINSINNSILKDLFDLNKIDWDLCETKAQHSLMIEICNEYNKDELLEKEIAELYSMCTATISDYIKRGKEIGLCNSDETGYQRYKRIIGSRKNK